MGVHLVPSFVAGSTRGFWVALARLAFSASLPLWAVASCSSRENPGATFSCTGAYGNACDTTCDSDDACNLGLYCLEGACVADCSPIQGCGNGKVCSLRGKCEDPASGVGGTACGTPPNDCPAQFHCSAGVCVAGCGPSEPCPAGFTCGSDAICRPLVAVTGFGGSNGTDGGNFDGDGCVNLTVGFENRTPTVVLLVDQSGSMDDAYPNEGSPHTRWTVLRDALMDPTTGAVKQMAGSVRIGIAFYTGHEDGTCPALTEVPIALDNYAAINAAYQTAQPDDNTPTGASIDAVAKVLAGEPDPKYILLVTDGQPDTCDDPNPPDPVRQDAANAFTISRAQAARAQGIGLFIMGVSNDIAPEHLQAMANAGSGIDPATTGATAAKYYVAADNQAELAEQLTTILGSVRTCAFKLGGSVASGREQDGIVSLDGDRLTYDDPNGFRLNNPTELEIEGTACEKIKSSSKGLRVSFPCDAIDITIAR